MKANTQGQDLHKHLFAVGYLAATITEMLTNDTNLAQVAYNAGILHDIGKVEKQFQKWVVSASDDGMLDGQHINHAKFSENNPRHHELSLLLFHYLRDVQDKSINIKNIELLEHVIFWHHAKSNRKVSYKTLQDIYNKIEDFPILFEDARHLLDDVQALSSSYNMIRMVNEPNDIRLKAILPKFKDYNANISFGDYKKDIIYNAKCSLIRSIVITSDRLISDLYVHELDNHINNGTLSDIALTLFKQDTHLLDNIKVCLDNFEKNYPNSTRNVEQSKIAKRLAKNNDISVLQGAAGCGKTKIALEWAYHKNAKKIIWVCPRVSVCQSIYHDLTSEEYLKSVNIELCTGEFKYLKINGIERPNEDFFSGDIIVTTIDQLSNMILTHKHIVLLLDAMNSHVIFDEYHEYITMSAFNLLFAEFLECKRLGDSNALLVSATPNPIFIEELLGIHRGDCIKANTFNDKPYDIIIKTFNDEDDSQNIFLDRVCDNSIIITNTVMNAQKGFMTNAEMENSLLLHGRLSKIDTKLLFDKTCESFGKDGSGEYSILRSSHIIQASINITCQSMISEVSHAENILQRLGRLNRFAENERGYLTIAIPLSMFNRQYGCGKFLNTMHIYDSANAWIEFLNTKTLSNITLHEIYGYYDEFYNDAKYRMAVTNDILKSLAYSVESINTNVLDPIQIKYTKKQGKRLKKNNLRGDSRYVRTGVIKVQNNKVYGTVDEYVGDENNPLTLEHMKILGYGDSNKDLRAHMHQKHHKYFGGKKGSKDSNLSEAARSVDFPIYLSYTVGDLANCHESNNINAIYYAVHDKQAIGLIETKNLNF